MTYEYCIFLIGKRYSLPSLEKLNQSTASKIVFLIINRKVLLLSYIILFNDLDIISDTYCSTVNIYQKPCVFELINFHVHMYLRIFYHLFCDY